MSEEVSALETHQPCPDCGSSDALTIYDDGHTCCFSCEKVTQPHDRKEVKRELKYDTRDISDRTIDRLKARDITESTCRRYNYFKALYKGHPVQAAPFFDDAGSEIGLKIRTKDKDFIILGKVTHRFFGQHLFSGGRKLIITEGEIDCLSVSQITGNKYPVVSIPSGTKSAKKVFQKNLPWLSSFEEVVVMFDNDDAGREAVEQVSGILPPGKMKIATLPLKDANDMLRAGRSKEVVEAIYNAKTYTPEGIIDGCELLDDIMDDTVIESYPWPWQDLPLQKMTMGIRKGEMLLVTAGTGIGKTTFVRYLGYYLAMEHGCRIGMAMLEEPPKRTAMGLMSVHAGERLHVKWNDITAERKKQLFLETMGNKDRFCFYNHFGSLEGDKLIDKLRYLAVAKECDFIVLDHISIAVSGLDSDKAERKVIDILMTRLRALVEETGVGLIVISHLRKVDGKSVTHENGGIISLDDLRGSGTLKQLPDGILALERNQQAENEKERQLIRLRILKGRFMGDTGIAGHLGYDKETEKYEPVAKVGEYTGAHENDSGGGQAEDYGF